MPTDLTDHFISWTRYTDNLAEDIRLAAAAAVEDGTVDSHRLAREIEQEVTYVQHCFREAPYICRHHVGEGRYRVHTADECGPGCQEKWFHANPAKIAPVNACVGCGIHVPPAADECDFCGAAVAA